MPAKGGWWAQLAIQHPRVNVMQERRPEPLTVPERPATALLRSPTSREMASVPDAWAGAPQQVQNQRFPAI